jgi:hypothetical protein
VKSHALASFWQYYDALPKHVQRLAKKNFALFKTNPRHPSPGFQKKALAFQIPADKISNVLDLTPALPRRPRGSFALVWSRYGNELDPKSARVGLCLK